MPEESGASPAIPPDSLEELERQYALFPSSHEALMRLAEGYRDTHRFHARAREIYESAALVDPKPFQDILETAAIVQKVEALTQQRRHNPEEVEDLRRMVSQLVDQFPGSAELRKALGDLRVLAGRPGYAVEQYRRCLELGYEPREALFDAFERKKDELPPDPAALDFFSELMAQIKAASPRTPTPAGPQGAMSDEAVEQIVQEHVRLGEVDEAIAILKRLALQNNDPANDHRIARLLLDDGRPWEAYEHLRQNPMDAQSKILMNEAAGWLEQDEQYDQAVEVLRHINENDMVVLEATHLHERQIEMSSVMELADLHYKNGRFLEALRHYTVLIQGGLSDISEFVGRIEAIIESPQAIPSDYLLFLAEFFRDRGERFRAVRFLQRLYETDEEPGDADTQRIANVVESILAAEPTQPPLCLGLGCLCLNLGKMDRAIQEFILATADPELQPQANRALAKAYIKTGQYGLALEKYRNLRLNTLDLEAIYDMIEPLEKSGADNDKIMALRLISDVDPAYQDVAQRLAQAERQSSPSVSLPSADPKMRALIGDLAIGRYRYVDKIGTGGMGVVYKVFDIKHNCVVAMKILRESLASSPKALTRFIREAQYVDQLNHPNIVHIFDFNISKIPGQSFIAMEFVDGPSMRQLLDETFKENRSIDLIYVQRIVSHCVQICDALEATHNEGIVHRDIKPDNIMITSRGMVKITDFGILHHEEMAYTPTGAVIGTPRYMSPEQVQGERIDGRSDIYALGILLYEMLTSAPPFITGDVAFQQINNTPAEPRSTCPLITEPLQHIILKCLAKKPEDRYQSARNLQEALLTELNSMGGTPPPSRTASGFRSTADIEHATPLGKPPFDPNLDEDLDFDQ